MLTTINWEKERDFRSPTSSEHKNPEIQIFKVAKMTIKTRERSYQKIRKISNS